MAHRELSDCQLMPHLVKGVFVPLSLMDLPGHYQYAPIWTMPYESFKFDCGWSL